MGRERRRPRRPTLLDRVRENRTQRKAVPAFPNYTQIPSLLSIRAWWVVRATGVVATLVVVVLCVAVAKTGLRIVWGIGIPLLPILFFIAPGLWRTSARSRRRIRPPAYGAGRGPWEAPAG